MLQGGRQLPVMVLFCQVNQPPRGHARSRAKDTGKGFDCLTPRKLRSEPRQPAYCSSSELEAIEVNCRCIDGIRHQLVDHYSNGQDHKRRCAQLLDEIFSDFALALYLFSVSLVVPARMLVRRALELGVASIYMWDLPHEYWGWSERDFRLDLLKNGGPPEFQRLSGLRSTRT